MRRERERWGQDRDIQVIEDSQDAQGQEDSQDQRDAGVGVLFGYAFGFFLGIFLGFLNLKP